MHADANPRAPESTFTLGERNTPTVGIDGLSGSFMSSGTAIAGSIASCG
jgi:hypothetical protein